MCSNCVQNGIIVFENPRAPVAQLDRVADFESVEHLGLLERDIIYLGRQRFDRKIGEQKGDCLS